MLYHLRTLKPSIAAMSRWSVLTHSQEERKSRAEAIQASAADTRISLHLPDGKKQQERDEKIRLASKGQGPNPDKVSCTSYTLAIRR